jgi:hypothetical protein
LGLGDFSFSWPYRQLAGIFDGESTPHETANFTKVNKHRIATKILPLVRFEPTTLHSCGGKQFMAYVRFEVFTAVTMKDGVF